MTDLNMLLSCFREKMSDLEQLLLYHDRLGVSHPWVLVHGTDSGTLDGLQISLNRQILFFDMDKRTLGEVYSVDGVRIERRIGVFDEDFKVS